MSDVVGKRQKCDSKKVTINSEEYQDPSILPEADADFAHWSKMSYWSAKIF